MATSILVVVVFQSFSKRPVLTAVLKVSFKLLAFKCHVFVSVYMPCTDRKAICGHVCEVCNACTRCHAQTEEGKGSLPAPWLQRLVAILLLLLLYRMMSLVCSRLFRGARAICSIAAPIPKSPKTQISSTMFLSLRRALRYCCSGSRCIKTKNKTSLTDLLYEPHTWIYSCQLSTQTLLFEEESFLVL